MTNKEAGKEKYETEEENQERAVCGQGEKSVSTRRKQSAVANVVTCPLR